MSDYIKYQHVEKLGSSEVDGITLGTVYVFPKIDGTNAHAWWDNGMHYGSRRRELSVDSDNAGFMAQARKNIALSDMCESLGKGYHVFGEWLVPHSLKTYREDAWRKLYIFDIVKDGIHMPYEEMAECCNSYGLEYIAPLRIITNPTIENIYATLDENKFLIGDGDGVGEGVVLKNYDFVNKYGRQTWAKVVTNEFKEKHHKEMGAPVSCGTKMVEESIVEEFVTTSLIEKTMAKISVENDGWNSKFIPQLLGRVFHDLVVEHTWDACKKYKNPCIDFKNLNRFCIMKIKQSKPELF